MRAMIERYKEWIYAWETRLSERDKNRVVSPLDWGLEWTAGWRFGNIPASGCEPEEFLDKLNEEIVAQSDLFYAYKTPSDFHLEGDCLFFTSPVRTPVPNNNRVRALWFPAGRRAAVVVLPQWNAGLKSHNALCRIFNMLGIAALRLSMPYHDIRRPAGITRADYAVSANMARTIDATRQGIADIRSCMDWLEQRGYSRLGIVGTSLGSCYAFLASAHDPRIRVNVFNHASTSFGDVAWTGQSTQHIRQGVEEVLTQDELRRVWTCISPIVYFNKFERWPKKSLMIYGRYDLTFLPEFSVQTAGEFLRRGLDTTIKALPCGHYSLGETPYKYMDAWHISRFLTKAFAW